MKTDCLNSGFTRICGLFLWRKNLKTRQHKLNWKSLYSGYLEIVVADQSHFLLPNWKFKWQLDRVWSCCEKDACRLQKVTNISKFIIVSNTQLQLFSNNFTEAPRRCWVVGGGSLIIFLNNFPQQQKIIAKL